jgi:signal transduction histidine kinase
MPPYNDQQRAVAKTNKPIAIPSEKTLGGTAFQTLIRALAVGIIYGVCVIAAIVYAKGAGVPAPIWIADGIAIGLVLLLPQSSRWALIVAVLIANIAIGMANQLGAASLLTGSTVNALQILISVMLMERVAWRESRAISLWILLVFYALLVIAIPALAAVVQGFVAAWQTGGQFRDFFMTAFISDALGIALCTPLVIIWGLTHQDVAQGKAEPLRFRQWRFVEGVLVFAVVVLSAYGVFSSNHSQDYSIRPDVYFCLPGLLWLALRFGLRSVTAGVLLTAVIGVFFTLKGLGQFAMNGSLERALLEVQLFMLVLSFTIFLPAVLFNAQRNTTNQLYDFMRRSDAVLRASGNVVFEIDVESRAIKWSGDTVTVLGWPLSDIATIDLWNEKVHPDDIERLIGLRRKLASGDIASEMLEYRIFRADGSEIKIGVGAYGATFYDVNQRQQQRVIVGLVKDITAVSALAERNQLLDTSLRQSQKMESLGMLAGGIAHDFNNILAAILGYGEMAESKLNTVADLNAQTERSKLTRYLDTILQAAERGRLLVAQVLTFSRRAPEQQSAVDLAALTSEIVQLLRGSFKYQIMLDLENRRAMTIGDATALHQLVMNICTNGLQAIAAIENSKETKRGLLSVLLTDREFDEPQYSQPDRALSRELAPGRYALLRIADDGIGMTTETRERMFDPFFTTKSVGSGTGLGLSLAMSIAHAHGGAIQCETSIGHGTIFSVYLPYLSANTEISPVSDVIHPRGTGQIIMLVDDEVSLQELGKEILASLGYAPEVFGSSEAALAAFTANPTRYAALLTDEVMPDMTGTQLSSRVHAIRADLPILIITAYGGAGFQLRAEEAGVQKILKKPYRHDDLAAALGEVLR